MMALGFSLNMLSLLGMVLAIGLVVDDAIVVVENVERQLEAGLPPLEATRKAMSEVTGPIIATTAVLMAVFVPVAFIPGRRRAALQPVRADHGDLGRHLGLQLAHAQPGAQRRLPASHRPAPALRAVPLVQRRLRVAVARLLAPGAGLHPLPLGSARRVRGDACSAPTRSGPGCPRTFLPVEDQGYFFVVIQGPDGASLERTDAVAQQVRDVLQKTNRGSRSSARSAASTSSPTRRSRTPRLNSPF